MKLSNSDIFNPNQGYLDLLKEKEKPSSLVGWFIACDTKALPRKSLSTSHIQGLENYR